MKLFARAAQEKSPGEFAHPHADGPESNHLRPRKAKKLPSASSSSERSELSKYSDVHSEDTLKMNHWNRCSSLWRKNKKQNENNPQCLACRKTKNVWNWIFHLLNSSLVCKDLLHPDIIIAIECSVQGFPGDSEGKEPTTMQETEEMWVQSLGQEDLLEKEMATHSSVLPGKSHGQRSLEGFSPWGHKESDTTEVTEHTQAVYTPDNLLLILHALVYPVSVRSHQVETVLNSSL